MEQDFIQAEQVKQDSFENFETKKSKTLLSAFFDDCNDEEQKIINEFSQTLGVRANDAIWIFVKVFFKINRANNTLPQRISDAIDVKQNEFLEAETQKAMSDLSETLMKISHDFNNQQKRKLWLYDFFIPVACTCFGIFSLCLISFIGGSAVAGKGWGHSPVEALLNAPAGWIIPLALIPVGGVALFRGLTEQGRNKYLNLIMAAIVAALVSCVLLHIL